MIELVCSCESTSCRRREGRTGNTRTGRMLCPSLRAFDSVNRDSMFSEKIGRLITIEDFGLPSVDIPNVCDSSVMALTIGVCDVILLCSKTDVGEE